MASQRLSDYLRSKLPATLPYQFFFKLLKEEIIRLSDEGFSLLRMSELKQQLEMRLPDDPFTYDQLKAVVGLLAAPEHVWQLEFGQFVLLHSERINSYAA